MDTTLTTYETQADDAASLAWEDDAIAEMFGVDGEDEESPRDCTYVLTVDTGADDEMRSVMEAALQDMGWDVEVRAARRSEITDAVYVVTGRGDLQILGHTFPVPEELEHAMSAAWKTACERP